MRKLLNNPWIVAALALAAVAFVGQSVWSGQTPGSIVAAVVATRNDAATPTPAPASADEAAAQSTSELLALSGTAVRRDPFAPAGKSAAVLVAIEKAKPDLLDTVHLSALWSQDGAIYAVINGSILQAGDEIGRLKVESVTTDGVWLVHWKGRDHLDLGGDFTLRTPAGNPAVLASSL